MGRVSKRPPRFFAAMIGLSIGLSACSGLSPQLAPPDIEAMEQVVSREDREALYTENSIYRHYEPQGLRYTRGTHLGSSKRSWQSLEAILRSDRNSSEALPTRKLRAARILIALTLVSSMVMVAGISASAREGFDFKNLNGGGGLLIGGGLASVGLAVGAGVSYNQARKGYDHAVDVYNDSLGMRLGVLTPEGEYRPPPGVVVDEEGFVLLDDGEEERPARVTYLPQAALPVAAREQGQAPLPRLSVELFNEGIGISRAAIRQECTGSVEAGRSIVAEVMIDGPSGRVVQVVADNDLGGTCVASQLFLAVFPPIEAQQQAFSITLRF